ncbi:histidinol dehydrogenase [Candidatus Pantoea carbekii]|nr:histidinol dehydrogenase HisD [Candidatus Pantoea carbekii]
MPIIKWQKCSKEEKDALLKRPTISYCQKISQIVHDILIKVKENGDIALREFNVNYDQIYIEKLRVSRVEMEEASNRVDKKVKQAMKVAFTNIETFHRAQKLIPLKLETQPGVCCQQITRPIKSVGLYIPGGLAPLFSTVFMLAIPANIAGCSRLVLCSPPPIPDEILSAALLCNVTEVFSVGGAQAIAALSFGTESILKVDKIFGPGNVYVTEAKRQVSQHFTGVATDIPAGPSELLVIADEYANPIFIAADLLSQAEHGPDSQVMLLTPSLKLAENVHAEIKKQLAQLKCTTIIRKSLKNSYLIVMQDLKQCIEISNNYGPEHLMIQTDQPHHLLNYINNAGSIFLGEWSLESAGDYASGTNHVLPTYGYSKMYSSLGLADFQKRMTVQELTPKGFLNLASTIEILATAEKLEAHKNAVTLRVAALKD